MTVRVSDVAAAAGVSRSTASMILTGKGERYSQDSRKRVLGAAEELGYESNVLADSFREQRSFLVGVLCNGVNYEPNTDLQRGIQSALVDMGLTPLTFTHNGLEEELECLEQCRRRMVEGLIVNTRVDQEGRTNAARFAERAAGGFPMVEVFGRTIPGIPSITFDYAAAARIAVERLTASGCRRIVHVTHEQYRAEEEHPGLYWNARAAWQGYTDAVAGLGHEPIVVTHRPGRDLTRLADRAAVAGECVEAIFSHPSRPDGVFCMDEEDAGVLAMEALRRGVKLPVACPGSSHLQAHFRKDIMVLPFPTEQVGRRAVEMLNEVTEGKAVASVALPPEPPADS